TLWLPNWVRKGWKTAGGDPVKNRDLWERLHQACGRHTIDWRWVKGHSGDPDNERVDALAREAAMRQRAAIAWRPPPPVPLSPFSPFRTDQAPPTDPMRHIVLDTETTGLEWRKDNRIVEIGCVELVERRPTGRTFHRYINPEREFEAGAQEVTGLTLEFLADKPRLAEIADEFIEFVDGAEQVLHNAAFDMGCLEYELERLGGRLGRLRDRVRVTDSLELARQRYPGQRNSLDALCRRLGVDNSHRQLHGALLDAQ